MVHALAKYGWTPEAPDRWLDPDQREWKIAGGTQHDAVLAFAKSASDAVWRRTAAARPRDSAGAEQELDLTVPRRLLDKTQGKSEAPVLRQILTGACWTQARRQEAFAEPGQSNACPTCGEEGPATEEHLFWRCSGHAARREESNLSQADLECIRRMPPITRCRGLPLALPRLAPSTPLPSTSDGQRDLEGLVATDGGALNPADPRVRRAGWAVWAPEAQNEFGGLLTGPRQTVYRAEAVRQALRRRRERCKMPLLIDNQAVASALATMIKAFSLGTFPVARDQAEARGKDQDIWCEIWDEVARAARERVGLDVTWVPSHTEGRDCERLQKARLQPGWQDGYLEHNKGVDERVSRYLREAVNKGPEQDLRDDLACRMLVCMTKIMICEWGAGG